MFATFFVGQTPLQNHHVCDILIIIWRKSEPLRKIMTFYFEMNDISKLNYVIIRIVIVQQKGQMSCMIQQYRQSLGKHGFQNK